MNRNEIKQANRKALPKFLLLMVAALLIGGDDADTDRRVQDFCAAYQSSLTRDIQKRLPEQPPTITAPLPQRPKRGIQRIR